MRLFCGLDVSEGVQRRLAELVGQLRQAARLRWTSVENLHITTRFIGEWPAGRLHQLRQALAPLAAREPIPIQVRALGWFPDPRRPRVFWAGIEAPPALSELALATDTALAALQVPAESRPFSPHLTLARVPLPVPQEELLHRIAGLESAHFGAFTAREFYLYSSEPGPGGAVYTKLAAFPFLKP